MSANVNQSLGWNRSIDFIPGIRLHTGHYSGGLVTGVGAAGANCSGGSRTRLGHRLLSKGRPRPRKNTDVS